jgi:hypothetical protein
VWVSGVHHARKIVALTVLLDAFLKDYSLVDTLGFWYKSVVFWYPGFLVQPLSFLTDHS